MRRVILVWAALATISCAKGEGEKEVPNPLAPGEVATLSLCGATNENRAPCADAQDNVIQFRVHTQNDRVCPCFSFTMANLAVSDLGRSGGTTFDFTGFRPGTYTVTGQAMSGPVDFTFWHNTSTSTIGVVPSSIQHLSGPVRATNESCRIGYATGFNETFPANFSFQFTIAAGSSGGSC
jgi:hypothetical protein